MKRPKFTLTKIIKYCIEDPEEGKQFFQWMDARLQDYANELKSKEVGLEDVSFFPEGIPEWLASEIGMPPIPKR